MGIQKQYQHWNTGATEIQQLNPGDLTKNRSSSPNLIKLIYSEL